MSKSNSTQWTTTSLGSIVTFWPGYAFPEVEQGKISGDIPFFKVGDMSRPGNDVALNSAEHYVTSRTCRFFGWKPCPAGAVAFAKVGAALLKNRRRLITQDTLLDNNMLAVAPRPGISSRYLYWLMQTIDFSRFVQDGAVPSVNQNQIGSYKVAIAPLSEQQKITEVLDTVDEAVRSTERLIAKLYIERAGIIQERLGEWESRHADNSDGSSRDVRWVQLGDIVRETLLGTPLRGRKDGNILLVKMGNISGGMLNMEHTEHISRSIVGSSIGHLELQHGDLLFNTRNTPDLVGKTAVWPKNLPPAICDNNILRIRFQPEVLPEFVNAYMSWGLGRNRLARLATGTTSVAAIYWRDLCKFPIPVPAISEQRRLVSGIDYSGSRLSCEQVELEKFLLIKQGLMDDLLAKRVGVWDVSDVDTLTA
ncbi:MULTISPECIES: restriction endonuclease subunit S [Frankia]|nr:MULTISPECIES: restriction endonuclease subunit S [Frankia]